MTQILKIINKTQEAEEVIRPNGPQITEADAIFSIFTDMFGGSLLSAAAEAAQEYAKETFKPETTIKVVDSALKTKSWIPANNSVSDLIKRRKKQACVQIGNFSMMKSSQK
jgi:hypothetical protein